jgi:septal ring factor EnvC (AmiA/AmiB activator)
MRNFLKWVIIIGFILVALLFIYNKGYCQTEESVVEILTSMRVDIRYIKSSIDEIKADYRNLNNKLIDLEIRVTRVEDKTTGIENTLCEITERNNWYLGIFGLLVGGMLLFQYKRSLTFRSGNGEKLNKDNQIS